MPARANLDGMQYAILRTQKLNSRVSIGRSLRHAFRQVPTPNADAERTPDNTHVGASSSKEAMAKLDERLPAKHRKDAVLCIEYLVTASPEAMRAMGRADQDAYFNDALHWLRARHGAANVVYAGIHRDETTPHMYAYVVPLDPVTKRLNAKRWLGGATALSEMQTDFAEQVGARHNLVRGIEGSKAKHQRVKRHYGLVNRAADQVAQLGMLDRASLGVGKPTKRAIEAVEAGDSYLAIAQQHQATQKAQQARERAIHNTQIELRNQMRRAVVQQAEGERAQKQVAELRRQLEAEQRKTLQVAAMAKLYEQGRDAALDELRELRPQHGYGPSL